MRVSTPQQTAGVVHGDFQSVNTPSQVLSYTEELELEPDLAHSGHERQRGSWNKLPITEYCETKYTIHGTSKGNQKLYQLSQLSQSGSSVAFFTREYAKRNERVIGDDGKFCIWSPLIEH